MRVLGSSARLGNDCEWWTLIAWWSRELEIAHVPVCKREKLKLKLGVIVAVMGVTAKTRLLTHDELYS